MLLENKQLYFLDEICNSLGKTITEVAHCLSVDDVRIVDSRLVVSTDGIYEMINGLFAD